MSKQPGFLILIILLALSLSMAFPVGVLADETTPPATEEPAAEPAVTEEPAQEPPSEPAVTEEPSAAEVPSEPTESLAQETEVPATDAVAGSTDENAEQGESPVSEILGDVPADTAIVVLDFEGESQPLTTQESAQILMNGDPMWCPVGQVPGTTSAPNPKCTKSFPSFTLLIEELKKGSFSGPGTIYVSYDYSTSSAGESGVTLTFDQTELATLGDLTIQGGWSFASRSVVGTSSFSGTGIQIGTNSNYWNGNVTLMDLVISGAKGSSVTIYSNSNVTLTDVSVGLSNSQPGGGGGNALYINARGNASLNKVDVTKTKASLNMYNNGAYVRVNGNVSIMNSNFDDNSGFGIYAQGSAVNISNSTFSGNGTRGIENFGTGLRVLGTTVNLSNVTVSNNNENGAIITDFNTVNISQSTFSNNKIGGLNLNGVDSTSVTLNGVTASGNKAYGAYVGVVGSGGGGGTGNFSLNIASSTFNNNAAGPIAPSWYRPIGGLVVEYDPGTTANGFNGVNGFTTLNNFVATGNSGYGAYISGGQTIDVQDSVFSNNGVGVTPSGTADPAGSGLYVEASQGGNIDFVTAGGNTGAGLFLNSSETGVGGSLPVDGGGFVVTCSDILDNDAYGIKADINDGSGSGVLQLQSVTFTNNAFGQVMTISGTVTETSISCESPPPPTPPPSTGGGGTSGTGGTGSAGTGTTSEFGLAGARAINLSGGVVELSCQEGSTTIKLPDETTVIFGCPTGDHGRVSVLEDEKLPAKLPETVKFAQALQVDVLLGETVLPPMQIGGFVNIGFPIVDGTDGNKFVVYFWDPSQNDGKGDWVELPLFARTNGKERTFALRDPADALSILSGVQILDNMVWVKTNFPGTFLLAIK